MPSTRKTSGDSSLDSSSRGIQHDALDVLAMGIGHRRVNWILDANDAMFFDAARHEWLIHFLESPFVGARSNCGPTDPGQAKSLRRVQSSAADIMNPAGADRAFATFCAYSKRQSRLVDEFTERQESDLKRAGWILQGRLST